MAEFGLFAPQDQGMKILAMINSLKFVFRYPEALRAAFPRLREKLEDPDPGVQSAAVNVICELARKNPKNYLSLAPTFFKLMTTSTNNWMLIKIIKLFGALTPLEPRLGRKLIEPLTNLIHSTSAMSLLYECINTVIAVLISISSGMPNHSAAIKLCVQKLRILIEDSDQNLKYLGLLAMSKILKTNPKSVQGHKDLVMQCLDDSDESIRLRALDLLYGMVSKKNLMEIVKKLMVHMDKAEGNTYRDELMEKIIQICSQNDYQFITNFEWYISVLVELTRMEGIKHGSLLASQMMDVAIRVESIRPFTVTQMSLLIENHHLLMTRSSTCEVLYAAAWICGEFAVHLSNPEATLMALFRGKASTLPGHVQAVYVHNAFKLFAFIASKKLAQPEEGTAKEVMTLAKTLGEMIKQFVHSSDLEVQERSSSVITMLKGIYKTLDKGDHKVKAEEIGAFFVGELNPVGQKAQKKVPVPEGLDLDAWINEPPPESEEESEEDSDGLDSLDRGKFQVFVKESSEERKKKKKKKRSKDFTSEATTEEPTPEELKQRKEARLLQQSMNPNYLKDVPRSPGRAMQPAGISTPIDDVPIQTIDLGVPLHIPGLASADQYLNISRESSEQGDLAGNRKKKKKSKKKKSSKTVTNSSDIDEEAQVGTQQTQVVVRKNLDMPEGAVESGDDDDDNKLAEDDPHRALADVDLDDLDYQAPYKPKQRHDVNNFGYGDGDIPTSLFGSDIKKKSKKKKRKSSSSENKKELDVSVTDAKEKKSKKKKKKDANPEETLLNGDLHASKNDITESTELKKKKKKKKNKEEDSGKGAGKSQVPETNDIDFWLSNNDIPAPK